MEQPSTSPWMSLVAFVTALTIGFSNPFLASEEHLLVAVDEGRKTGGSSENSVNLHELWQGPSIRGYSTVPARFPETVELGPRTLAANSSSKDENLIEFIYSGESVDINGREFESDGNPGSDADSDGSDVRNKGGDDDLGLPVIETVDAQAVRNGESDFEVYLGSPAEYSGLELADESQVSDTYVETYTDTLYESPQFNGYSGHPASVRERIKRPEVEAGVTTFENGYIPSFEEDLVLADTVPHVRDYVSPAEYRGLVRRDEALARQRAIQARRQNQINRRANSPYHSHHPVDYTEGYYGDYYDNYYDSQDGTTYHNPNGPYSYRLGEYDPAINDRFLYQDGSFSVEADVPFLTSQFDPDQAHFKIGGLYFEAISLEAGVLYSDYDGPQRFRRGEEDGFLGFVGFRLRAAARVARNLYITADAQLIYLIGANELAVRAGTNGSPFVSLVYREHINGWDIMIYDHVGTAYPYFIGADATERAGRYQFGFTGYDRGVFDTLYHPVIYNRFGIAAETDAAPGWKFRMFAQQADYFRTDSSTSDDHDVVQQAGARLQHTGMQIPFNPWVEYRAVSTDYFDTAFHQVTAGGRHEITDRLSASAMGGYLWSSGSMRDSGNVLWRYGMRHQISERTLHGFRVGQAHYFSGFSDASALSEYFQYFIKHQLRENTSLYAYAQWSEDEYLTGSVAGSEFERETYGVRLTHRSNSRTKLGLGYQFEERRNALTGEEDERNMYEAYINSQIGYRMTGYLRYQFEETSRFDESLYTAGVRRYF